MSAVRTYENSERPDGWRLVRLGELVGMNQGGTPRKEDPEYWDGSIPFLTGADLTDFRVGRQHARSFLTDAGLVSGHTAVCEAGTLLLATRTRVGLAGIATELMGASQDITCLYPNEQIDSEFLCRTLLRLAPELQRLSRGTTIQGITREDVCSVPVLIPPLSEQRAIADVLDSIDEVIERTEAVIAATETLRDALLHELLTRGVPGWHTKWKDVPGIGTIPADWKVVLLADVATVERGKFAHRPRNEPRFYGGDIPFIQTSDVVRSVGVIRSHSQTLNESGLSISKLFPTGTVVITIAANIGETAITGYPMAFPDSLVGMIPTRVDSRFLEYYVRTQKARLERFAPESAQKNINLEDLRPMLVPVPSKDEQTAIAEQLGAVQYEVDSLQALLADTRTLKTSMANELLSGRAGTQTTR